MLGMVKKVIQEYSPDIKRLKKQVERINELEPQISALSDDELKGKTIEFKEKLERGKSLDDIKIEAFAVVREAAKRVLGQRHYDVQLLGGLVLHEGSIAEMQTGEGKTLVASLSSYLHALKGKGVHVITVNEYLARRDYETIGRIHRFLGLSVGLNLAELSMESKQEAYKADITYGTGNEFGFDYLRDHMVLDPSEKVQRPLYYAIIDEIDSILIDEARTPLIIANKSHLCADLFYITNQVVSGLKKDVHYEVVVDSKQLFLTEKGTEVVEKMFGISNLFDAQHQLLYHFILQSLRAHTVMKRDVDYIIKDGEVLLVDSFTGRVMEGRSYSEGLQQAIEAKEGLEIKDENETQATITIQNYFRLYSLLAGMTGTASTEKAEFQHTYGLHVIEVPTNKPKQRIDLPDVVFATLEDKYKRIVADIRKYHETGRPILVGTTSIEQSEYLSGLLTKEKLPHLLLNAKSEEQEARIISLAGQKGSIMIATNMAGRGTDILLGEGVAELGGLHIIGTERHESRRIDNQLRGRAGRQGDPGSSQFILSLEDELFTKFDKDEMDRWKKKVVTNEEGEVIQPDPLKFVNKIQLAIEGIFFSAREHLLKIDDVSDQQRKVVYALRNRLLEETAVLSVASSSVKEHAEHLIETFCLKDTACEDWDMGGFTAKLADIFPEQPIQLANFKGLEYEDVEVKVDELLAKRKECLDSFTEEEKQAIEKEMKILMLRALDELWLQHLDRINFVKEGIHLNSYAQEDPYRMYERDAFELFKEMQREWHEQLAIQLAHRIKVVRAGTEG
ncbi:accessory Sec system translocase SecA2 [Fictibacillus gelatini]|uniref:accessory Sec system translocase SecA2 n=1 Tax=Fictibacillus gelatini TaxID=225985 RepID=UPI0003FD9781|nr:accessory Sec system translocase SecA2 [Fictibacillus gelatini]